MKVLVVGGGGREHALAWKVVREGGHTILAAPPNAGLARLGEPVGIAAGRVAELADYARANAVDFTIVGPEAPLIDGVVDEFIARGLRVFGPKRAAARIEGSKVFAKNLMRRHRIPTGDFDVFDDPGDAKRYIRKKGAPIVVKADGIAAGKGVIVADTVAAALEAVESIMEERVFGDAGERVVVEEKLVGPEISLLFFTDGETVEPLCPARDYKAVGDGDVGPNTGGMGCYSPVPLVDDALIAEATERVVRPTIRALLHEGARYRGVLYTGLILTNTGLRVLEFNARFGDPETQVQMPRLATPLVEILQACGEGRLAEVPVRWHDNAAVCVVMCSQGYPGSYKRGMAISGLDEADALPDTTVFHAGTRLDGESVVTSGGRVLGVTGTGPTLKAARSRAYEAVAAIRFDGAFCRRDIADSVAI
jgi:phosphoribosylamine--glycine ligase